MTNYIEKIQNDELNMIHKTLPAEETIFTNKTHFFGVRFDNISKSEALNIITNFLIGKKNSKARKIFFTNVHTIYLAERNPAFAEIINNADMVLPDGSGLKLAGKMFSRQVKENLNGTDFTPLILESAQALGKSVYLLGAEENVIKNCVEKLKKRYHSLMISGFHSGFFSQAEENKLFKEIKEKSPDILLVAMGSPVQEMLINKIAPHLEGTVCFAVGGLFDFISGTKKRAPAFFRKLGFEWVYRFFQDPKTKWDRIVIEIPAFLLSVVASRFITNNIFSSADRRLSLML